MNRATCYFVSAPKPTFLPQPLPLPPPTLDCPGLGVVVETKLVRGNKKEGRCLYVQVDGVRYTSPVLSSSDALINTPLRLHIREEDMRLVHAYLPSGDDLGLLYAEGRWGRTPHTREMRKKISALCKSKEIRVSLGDDPVQKLLGYYVRRSGG